MRWISCSGRAIGFAVFCAGFLGSALLSSSSFAQAQETTPKSSPAKTAHTQTQGSRRRLQDSDKVIFDAIAAIDRYEASSEKPATKELLETQKQAVAAVKKITDPALLPYIWMLMDWVRLITVDEAMVELDSKKEKEKDLKKRIMEYHKLRDGIVEQVKANHCCYPQQDFNPA